MLLQIYRNIQKMGWQAVKKKKIYIKVCKNWVDIVKKYIRYKVYIKVYKNSVDML